MKLEEAKINETIEQETINFYRNITIRRSALEAKRKHAYSLQIRAIAAEAQDEARKLNDLRRRAEM